MKLIPLVMLGMIVIAGCSAESQNQETSQVATPGSASSEPTRPGSCDVTTERAMGATIGTQIDALRAGDFEAAYDMAAPSFQSAVPREAFEAIIMGGFQSLLDAQSHTLSDCVVFPNNLANTVVTVRTIGGSTFTYYYAMINTEQGWRVLGATEIGPAGSAT